MVTDILAVVERPAYPRRTTPRPWRTEGRVVLAACGLAYLGIAVWFWRSGLVPGDSVSRVANAYYVLFSGDPHLAAVGFVWNPLPSLVLLPALPLAAVFPALTQDGLLAGIASALSMAGTVAIVNDMLQRLGVARRPRWVLTLALAAHPMTLIYAGNGMSESLFLLCLVAVARGLQQWLAEGRAASLVVVGIGLGLAYGTRYEALAPAAAVPFVVFAVSAWRGRGGPRRWPTAFADAILAALPAIAAVGLWAIASKIIVDQWFATFSSEYGNAAQVSANSTGISSVTGVSADERLAYALRQLLGLQPLLAVAVVAAIVVALRRRDPRLLAPATVFGSVLAFDNLAFVSGGSFGWLRFQIAALPLVVLLLGTALAAPLAGRPGPGGERAARVAQGTWPGRARLAGALAIALLALPSSLWVLNTPALAREESEWFTPEGAARTADLSRLNHRVAADLDALRLPDGAVVTDSAYAFAIILASARPRQFVITSDRDFHAVLDDPAGHGARYLLISMVGGADAVRRRHPVPSPAARTDVRVWVDRAGNPQWTLVPV